MLGKQVSVRVDKWLWAARFYKTRSLASAAIRGGKIHINGSRVKPSRNIALGDTLIINKSPTEWQVVVDDISDKRLAAPLAQQLYHETAASIEKRQENAQLRKLAGDLTHGSDKRPDKKSRRQLINLKHKNLS